MKKITGLALAALFSFHTLAQQKSPWLDKQLPVTARVKLLLGQMTLEEKIAQLRTTLSALPKADDHLLNDRHQMDSLFRQGIGMINPDDPLPIDTLLHTRNVIQTYLRNQTRLGIPAIFIDEAHHGLVQKQADIFPTSIGLACSWDTLLTERIYDYVARQAYSRGTNLVLAPVIDAGRDPRWGRFGETFGEDPYLCGLMGSAVVRGFQGSSNGRIATGHVASTLKHFTAHGQSEAGSNQAPGDFPERVLRTFHMEPFRLAIGRVKPAAIMPSYVDIDGIPSHASKWLLTDVLRKEWHYQGILVSDWWGINQLYNKHHVAADQREAALQAFTAGVTVDMPLGDNYSHLTDLVKKGKISLSAIDDAVSLVLKLKFDLGLFDERLPLNLPAAQHYTDQPEGRALARKAAEESMVLLKNNGILPLRPGQYHKIAVIGPCAAVNYVGDYSGQSTHSVSLLEGIQNKLKGEQTQIVYAKGVDLSTADGTIGHVRLQDPAVNRRKIDSAVAAAKDADLIICALGQNEQFGRESWSANNLGDMSTLDLLSNQDELLHALKATGKPVIVYLAHSRPLSINYVNYAADAILDGWFTGEESGNAAANIIFGDVNPSGKLTATIPRSVGQLPMHYDDKPSAHYFAYVTEPITPLYPFGFGLSYTNYRYGKPELKGNTLSVIVTNTGKMAGDEIVQLYVHPRTASVTQPVKALKGFSRISLKAGGSKTVSFTITKDLLAYYGKNMKRVTEPGIYELMTGPDTEHLQMIDYLLLPFTKTPHS